ncbi:hypothetical protein [Granulicella arctica]|uniref:MACPF domain-containing protein n=1 Tax=Granulicella arctica TaxID=940613 RepID=A0A7Y9PDX9_9BACT|nr:hypothetical protein [Granulicella arctica]NYF78155.1 hypothetical protein [Granulicella arctica]
MHKYSFVRTEEDDNVTRLPGVLTDQPWIDYDFGSGVSAITGTRGVEGGVIDFTISNYPALITSSECYSISSEDDLHTAYSAEATGSYNTSGLKVAASASFLRDTSYSESSMTVVVLYDVRTNGVGITNPSALELSPLAKEFLAANGDVAFREKYGDYFVSSCVAGSRFAAIYKIYTSSSSSLTQFQASVSVTANIASAAGAAKFEQDAHAMNAKIECKVDVYGTKGTAPVANTPAEIAKALDWFLARDDQGNPANLSYIPMRAYLNHFSSLSNSITNVYKIEPEVFGNIQSLRVLMSAMNSLADQLPVYFLNQPYKDGNTFAQERSRINTELEVAQDSLPHKPELVDNLHDRAMELSTTLRPNLALVSFYNNLQLLAAKETNNGSSTERYGTVSNPAGVPITIGVTTESKSIKAGTIGVRREYTFRYSNPDRVIVGWTIQDNWGDGTNGGWTTEKSLIGASDGSIQVVGERGRGINWTAIFYTVQKSDFPWVTALVKS